MRRLFAFLLCCTLMAAPVAAFAVQPVCTKTLAISTSAGATLVTNTNANFRIYVCALSLANTTAQSVSIVEGTGTVCATGMVALIGHVTVANGVPLASLGQYNLIQTAPFLATNGNGTNLCLLIQSGTLVTGTLNYTIQP